MEKGKDLESLALISIIGVTTILYSMSTIGRGLEIRSLLRKGQQL